MRIAPSYVLVRAEQLSAAEREALGRSAAAVAGVIRPAAAATSQWKLFDAASFEAVHAAVNGSVPGDAAERRLHALVLDGILEVETERGFVSGAGALLARGLEAPAVRADTPIARLSLEALRFAAAIDDDAAAAADRLYRFNRLPDTAATRTLVRDVQSAVDALGRSARFREPRRRGPWIGWTARRVSDSSAGWYKLYVGAALERVPEILAHVLEVAARADAIAAKIAYEPAEVLRCDRFVIYFDDPGARDSAGVQLDRDLRGTAAQPVPFTAAVEHPVVSCASDPLSDPFGLDVPSWRRWITQQLAGALVAGRTSADVPAEVAALWKAQLLGVDPVTWSVPADFWEHV